MKKRGLALILSLAMIVSILPITAFGADFTDMPNDWSTAALEKAVSNGLLKGDNGKIRAEDSLTRAEMATIVNRAFNAVEKAPLTKFNDLAANKWYYEEMAKAVKMETFVGSGDKLNPEASITREEAFVVLARAFKISEKDAGVLDGFSDKNSISDWAMDEVAALVLTGYVAGSNGQINPKNNITRAEFAQIMDNLVKTYITQAGEYTTDLNGNVMVNVSGVTLKGLTITGDLIIGDGVGDGEVIIEDTIVTGRMLVRGGGEDSIKITGNSNIKNIIIARVDGKVRIYTEDGVEVGEVIIDGNDDVILEGTFDSVTVLASDVAIFVTDATIDTATVEGNDSRVIIGENSTVKKLVLKGKRTDAEVSGTVKQIVVEETAGKAVVNVDKNGEVEEILANSSGTLIKGEGKVKKVQANADDVIVETEGTKVSAADGTEGVMAGDKEVLPGKTETVKEEVASPSSGGSSSGGGGGSSGGSDDDETLIVSGISIIDATTLEVTLSDNSVYEVTLDEALEPNVETEVTFEIDGKSYTETITWEVEIEVEIDVSNLSKNYYGEGDELTFTISGFSAGKEVTLGLLIQKELGGWHFGVNALDIQTSDGSWTETADESGILTVSGTVKADLPTGELKLIIPDYGYNMDNNISLQDEEGVMVHVGTFIQVSGIIINEADQKLELGATIQLTTEFTPENPTNKNVTWTSSDDSIAIVDATGMVEAVAEGEVTITVTTEDGSFSDTIVITAVVAATDTYTVTFDSNGGSEVAAITDVEENGIVILPAAPTREGYTFEGWYTDYGTFANEFTAATAVTADITVYAKWEEVVVPVSGISVEPTELILTVGATEALSATVDPSNATNKNITWSSDSEAVATVDQNGLVTAVAAGQATITVTTEDGGFDATATVTVPDFVVKTAEGLIDALTNPVDGNVILVKGTLGTESDHTIYQVNNAVTIQGAEGAKVFGTFRIESPDVIIKDLEIQNKGNTGTENDDHRSAIKLYGKSVTITNNKITNGMGDEVGLSNAIQIQTEEESSLSDYVIENNEFINNEQPSDKWKSTDILIQEGFGNYKAITASVDDYQSILAKNIFSGDVIKLAHMDYGKTINGTIYLFRSPLGKVTSLNDAIEEAEDLTESDYTADTWETLQTALSEAKEVSENIATADGTYQAEIIKARTALEDAIDELVETTKVATITELEEALLDESVTEITISEELGSDSNYTTYQVGRAVTIQGAEGAKVFGTFRVNVDDVTIKNLSIENEGDGSGERSAINIVANNVTIMNNTITNGLGENDGLSNAIQIRSPEGSSLSDYNIEDNNIIGHGQGVTKWTSTGILIIQNHSSITGQTITATAADYQNILDNNTFTSNSIDLSHMDYAVDTNYLFRLPFGYVISLDNKITEAEDLVEEEYTNETWETLQTALSEAKEVARNVADKKAEQDGTYQAEIINARTALEDAIDGLVKTGIE